MYSTTTNSSNNRPPSSSLHTSQPTAFPEHQTISTVQDENDVKATVAAREKQLLEQNLNHLRTIVMSVDDDTWMYLDYNALRPE